VFEKQFSMLLLVVRRFLKDGGYLLILAALAKKVYRVLAWDSLANAAKRFFSVLLPLNSIAPFSLIVTYFRRKIKVFFTHTFFQKIISSDKN
jgi:ACR3 family arsenite efflux pump ArsB